MIRKDLQYVRRGGPVGEIVAMRAAAMTTALRAGDSTGLVRIGVVGTTPYAEPHIAAVVAHPRAVLAGIAGRDAGRAAEVANRHGAGAVFTTWQSMLDSGAVAGNRGAGS